MMGRRFGVIVVLLALFVTITFDIINFDEELQNSPLPVLENDTNLSVSVGQLFNEAIENNACETIEIDPTTKLHNISGRVLAETYANESVYLAATRSTSFKTALQVAKKCHIYREIKISDDHGFSFSYVPPGKYVLFVKDSSYVKARGPPMPQIVKGADYNISIAFHGGDSWYMLSAFELTNN